ncbi:SMI1/KNR4 family protein [Pelagicoccus albus]|uniref:SMI1/KNR4 family protein n=1 Tax=Pelagicoccus albus TaxID=415222 RepID=A0A7X1EA06_9BACT|nr:SMI1/KNR4 family protein [Pelagicoccus albus]MBC2606307.1 SMI1/KNR4 family protein [Pelagicoccus albus]
MNGESIEMISSELSLTIPDEIKKFLAEVNHLPKRILEEKEILRDPAAVIALNKELRKEGYYHLPWFDHFFAIGSDPGHMIYYFDLSHDSPPAVLANHDYDCIYEYEILAHEPEMLVEYLKEMAEEWDKE